MSIPFTCSSFLPSSQLSELSVNRDGNSGGVASQMFLQGLGMFTGAIIMLFIAIYEHDIEDLINGALWDTSVDKAYLPPSQKSREHIQNFKLNVPQVGPLFSCVVCASSLVDPWLQVLCCGFILWGVGGVSLLRVVMSGLGFAVGNYKGLKWYSGVFFLYLCHWRGNTLFTPHWKKKVNKKQ